MSSTNQSTPCMNFMEYDSRIARFQTIWRARKTSPALPIAVAHIYARIARDEAFTRFQTIWRERRYVWGFYSRYACRARLEARMASSIAHKAYAEAHQLADDCLKVKPRSCPDRPRLSKWKEYEARAVDALPSRLKTILNASVLYDFYPDAILPVLLLIDQESKQKNNPIPTKYMLKNWGFIIYTEAPKNCNIQVVFIMFVFIFPDWRRKGHFQRELIKFKKSTDIVVLTSNQKNLPMYLLCIKNDLTPLAMTRSEDEIFFGWSDKYDGDFILKNVY